MGANSCPVRAPGQQPTPQLTSTQLPMLIQAWNIRKKRQSTSRLLTFVGPAQSYIAFSYWSPRHVIDSHHNVPTSTFLPMARGRGKPLTKRRPQKPSYFSELHSFVSQYDQSSISCRQHSSIRYERHSSTYFARILVKFSQPTAIIDSYSVMESDKTAPLVCLCSKYSPTARPKSFRRPTGDPPGGVLVQTYQFYHRGHPFLLLNPCAGSLTALDHQQKIWATESNIYRARWTRFCRVRRSKT